ncbi:thiamine diphosphate-binding protein [Mycena filopes]|nr:thiamine diphosphate-binding protein [Mycena filopes]
MHSAVDLCGPPLSIYARLWPSPSTSAASILEAALPFRLTTPEHAALGLPAHPLAFHEPSSDSALILQAALINQAQRPIIYTGAGVLSSPRRPALLRELAERGHIPVSCMLGAAYVNLAMQQVDVVIALGARFDNRVTNDPRAGGSRGEHGGAGAAYTTRRARGVVCGFGQAYPFTQALDEQRRERKGDVIITTGVGQHQMRAAQHYRWTHPQSMITSGGLGTMGFRLLPAIGAKVAALHKAVVDLDGDASFRMTATELATASQYGIGVKTYSTTPATHTNMTTPDFVALALRCDTAAELPAKMAELLVHDNNKAILMKCESPPAQMAPNPTPTRHRFNCACPIAALDSRKHTMSSPSLLLLLGTVYCVGKI